MTSTTRSTRFVVPRLIAVIALGVLALAACGGSSYGGSSSTQPSASNKPAAASGAAVATGQTDVGTVLVDQNGKTLYAFAVDAKNHSNCSGSCATYWPPVTVAKGSSPTASKDVSATLGTTTRSDGSTQLTVNGWPMYTYVGDTKAGDATGQGKNLSGGLWWVVDPSGAWVKKAASTSSGGGRGGY